MKRPYYVVTEVDGQELVAFGEYEPGYYKPSEMSATVLTDVLNATFQRGMREGAKQMADAFKKIALHVTLDDSCRRGDGTTLLDDATKLIKDLKP